MVYWIKTEEVTRVEQVEKGESSPSLPISWERLQVRQLIDKQVGTPCDPCLVRV